MAADRARISDDPARDYRAVVQQQGRVTLEADGNEASLVAERARRLDMIDVIGPFGTCDDGYEVTVSGTSLQVGAGSYHLGGWRLALGSPTRVGQFRDEIDIPEPVIGEGQTALGLLATEQEVSAVEDRALREVAIGGPDTAQRTRLMQRVVAFPVKGSLCDDTAAEVAKAFKASGATLDPATGAVLPAARLRVSVVSPPAPADPCDPPAAGGYLGADNRLIRVSVASYNGNKGTGTLVWGYDNASTLYRASTADGKLLTLEGEPVDGDHAPALGQAVEVLQTRTRFDNGDVVAADAGIVTTVAQPYDPDLRRVQIAATLPANKRGDVDRPLFVRLWQAVLPFSRGVAVELGDTGLAVTVTLDVLGDGQLVARPCWAFAARPSTPIIVYPRRYLDASQPPEGPRQWYAPLAVVSRARQALEVLDDCRDTFVPLTQIRSGCCGIVLDAEVHGRRDAIQRALDRLRGTRGTVTLRPGHYRLRKPIVLDASHKGLTLEGCGEGVFLEAADESDPAFGKGLIALDDVNEVALRALQFQMPAIAMEKAGLAALSLAGTATNAGIGSVAITATGCAQLTISDCQFRFRLKEARPMFGVAILARGECWGLALRRNRFLHDIDYEQPKGLPRLLLGFVLVPAVALTEARAGSRELAAGRVDALLEAGEITDNSFVGLTIAMLVMARLGYVRIERNRVHGCSGGILLLESAAGAAFRLAGQRDTVTPVPGAALAATMSFANTVPGASSGTLSFATADIAEAAREADARARMVRTGLAGEDRAEEDRSGNEATAVAPAAAVAGPKTLGSLTRVADAIRSRFDTLAPCIHVNGNDVAVFGTLPRDEPDQRDNTDQSAGLFQALYLLFDPRDTRPSDVIVGTNRFESARNPAVAIMWPSRMTFTGNLVRGSGGDDAGGALLVVSDPKAARIAVMANVIDRYARILPPDHPNAPSQDWSFLNRFS